MKNREGSDGPVSYHCGKKTTTNPVTNQHKFIPYSLEVRSLSSGGLKSRCP